MKTTNKIKWNDLIEEIIRNNNGISSLNYLYEKAPLYRLLPVGDWQKTLRGVLYREVNRGRFKKIGLGVYALSSYENENTAFFSALRREPYQKYLTMIEDIHSTIEGMLIEIGNFFEYKTYTSDINKDFDSKKLKELCSLSKIPDFTYPELKSIVSKIDTIWFSKTKLPFPKFIFEVESTTDFTNSMLKMYQIINYDSRFILVAPKRKEKKFKERLTREPFESVRNKFGFRSFEEVVKLYFSSVEHYELKSRFVA